MTMYKFSKTSQLLYPSESLADYKNLPKDLVDITDAEFQAAAARATGETLDYVNGKLVIVPAPPVVIPPAAKRDQALMSMTHTFSDGRVIQCRDKTSGDESNIRNAIERMQRLSIASQPWRMADNTMASVTVADLQEALQSGQDQAAAIWEQYFTDLAAV